MQPYQRTQKEQEQRAGITGLAVTLGVHALALVVLLTSGFTYLDPPPPERSSLVIEFEEEIELEKGKALAAVFFKTGAQIFPQAFVIKIESVGAAPVRARVEGPAVFAAQKPVGMLAAQPGLVADHERRDPDPRPVPGDKDRPRSLLQPARITQLRSLLLDFLFGGEEGSFNTARNVRNAATFFASIGMIPPAHYNEVFIAWGKAAVKLAPGTPISPTVSIESWTSGEPAAQPVLSDNPGGGAVTYSYARRGSDRYSEVVPTSPGSYTVKATVAPTHDYAGGTASADFEIRSGKPISVSPGYAEPEPVEQPVKLSFVDVPEDAWYSAAVRWAVERGVAAGTDETHFSPDAACTRAQAVTFLWRAAGSPEPTQTETPFTDVAAGSYYEKAVSWAVENGIVKGTSETTFSPDKTVTRAQAVAFLYRYAKAETEPVKVFEDVGPEAWYAGAVTWAAEQEIARGASGTAFSPDADCVRGQIVSFLYRLFV